MRSSQFAQIRVLVPPDDYKPGTSATARLKLVGMAQNINIDDNFGTRGENTLGTPLPVLAPGYQQTTIRVEKATIDGADFRSLGAFNPLWGHVGQTYSSPVSISNPAQQSLGLAGNDAMYPFMFILGTRNMVSNSYAKSNITYDNKPAQGDNDAKARTNPFGMYVCVLQSASISMSSNQAVIMDSVNAIARPLSGTWLTDAVKAAYSTNSADGGKNGMRDIVYEIMWGYRS